MARYKRPLSDNEVDRFQSRRSHRENPGSGRPSGGTPGSSSFRSVPQRDDPAITNHYFNTPGDGAAHGHVKEQQNADGTTSYPFVRDVEGNEYDAD
jgi:hypothetical protein